MAIADAAEWVIRQEGVKDTIHYLDDFLISGALNTGECSIALTRYLAASASQ